MNAAYNWWGTTNQTAIKESFYDYDHDFNLGNVTFVPFLTEPNPQAMPDMAAIPAMPDNVVIPR